MPARSPFTTLCQSLARPTPRRQADLHVHTTHSDGTIEPAGVIEAARRAGLRALAIADHDTLSGYLAAAALPQPPPSGWPPMELVPAVEITATFANRETHLLAYFVRPDDADLEAALAGLRTARVDRFRSLARALADAGVPLGDAADRLADSATAAHALGRRHLAELLVRAGHVPTVREAFKRYLTGRGLAGVPKERLPADRAMTLAHGAGGAVSLAHPPANWGRDELAALRELGLDAVEVDFPTCKPSRSVRLRDWASELGLAVTGGSDWHGPGREGKHVGECGVSLDELDRLRSCRLRS